MDEAAENLDIRRMLTSQ